jgi:hypothetical protein
LRVPHAGLDAVRCVIRLPGLDVAAWERAVARHPVLDSDHEGRDYEARPDFPARTHHRDFVEWCTARTRQPAGVSGASPLPFGKAADATVGQASQTVRFAVADEETVALHRLADRESVTPHTVVLAASPFVAVDRRGPAPEGQS